MIKYCPHCASVLKNSKKTGMLVKVCRVCEGHFLCIETKNPKLIAEYPKVEIVTDESHV